MDFGKERLLSGLKKYTIFIYITLVATVVITGFASIIAAPQTSPMPQIVWLVGTLVILIAVLTIVAKLYNLLETLRESDEKLEKINGTLEKNRLLLTQIKQNTRLSETAKSIAFRDADRQSLREAVFDKLHQQEFETTYEIIDEIATRPEYAVLAEQLHTQADRYRDATDQERANQVIAHIEKLLDGYQWAEASAQIERLIKTEPKSEKAKAMRQVLVDKKEERKKILLTAWDDAVKRQATDRSLEILRELDLYLTPNEGLALQEAARDVFRNKLHNLGVQFSLAVSEKQWAKALQAGKQIMRDFPNSRMSEEIREKMDILEQKVSQNPGVEI